MSITMFRFKIFLTQLLLVVNITGYSVGTQYSFLRVDASNGLVNNQTTCIYQDSRGFIWIGTSSGLSRFDGTNFVNYTHNDKDTNSIPDNYIVDIQEDAEGNLWIQTRWEYTVFDVKKERFIADISGLLEHNGIFEPISRVYIDVNKKLWFIPQSKNRFATFDIKERKLIEPFESKVDRNIAISDIFHKEGSYYFLYNNGVIESFDDTSFRLIFSDTFLNEELEGVISNGSIFVDNEKDLWVFGNNEGIYYYKTSSKKWNHLTVSGSDIKLSSNLIKKIIQDDRGLIWVGTDHGGIDVINKFSKSLQTLYHQTDNPKSLSQNSITDIFIDNNNIVWIGTFKKGICYYHESIHKFPHYHKLLFDKNSLPYNDVNCFAEDKKGNLWIGTNGGGLIYFDRINLRYTVYKYDPNNSNSISNDVIVSLFIDDQELLWIGTYTGGINTYNGQNFKRYGASKETGKGLSNDNIWTITQDKKNRIWIGTLGGGIVLFDKQLGDFIKVPNQGQTTLPSPFVNQIFKMRNGNLFIATGVGVVFYDIDENRYRNHPLDNRTIQLQISNNNVNAVYEDSRGLLWVATREGLTVIDPQSDFSKIFRKEDGLPQDIINCILEDEYQSIWVSKSSGISQIIVNPEKPREDYRFSIYNYTEADGLQGQEFNANASFKTRKGELIFGGPNGFNLFQTKSIKYNKNLSKVVFTDFQIFNKSVKVGEKVNNRVILHESILSQDELVIKHSMNVFSIEFAALNYFISSKVKYKYKLEGFDKDWMGVDGNVRKAVYTNLNAGSYIFKVKACNNDGLWNEDYAQLKLTILPPFYASSLAYVIYFILIIGALVFFRYSMLKKERVKFKIEQERLLARRNHDMDEMKLRFLTNVSHEFRTPLTLILTPLEKLLKIEKDDSERKLLETINRNARNLLDLVNQLLDFRKLDLHGLKYNPSYGDIIPFLIEVCGDFLEGFQRKGINFEFLSSIKQLNFNFDAKKLQKVMMNLISNALKFTPSGGNVAIIVELNESSDINDKYIIIRIKDSGVGILEEERDKIFERFYQSQNNNSLGISGSGIGLNLAKEMILLHGGTIRVESEVGKGSEFIVSIPVSYNQDTLPENKLNEPETPVQAAIPEYSKKVNGTKPVVLVIEDNFDFRNFMKESLQELYVVHEAEDGVKGFEMVHNIIPDIIISDVMMPHMDGLEMCKKLKSDIRTSHIPLVLLTARTADEDKIKGLEIGADDYITKPFNMDLLLLRVENLMDKQSKIQSQFQKNIDISPSEVEIPSMEEKLIKKAISFVEKNIAEAKFSVEDLSRELGMSRVYLYKKLLAITGKSPVEFIRIIRLKRGAQLLEKSQFTVAEVAYKVGFNSPRYFSKYFKEEYGILPTDFAKKYGRNTPDKIDLA